MSRQNPKPTALKKVLGTARKDRTVANEPKPLALVSLDPPAHIQGEAASLWKRLAPILDRMGVLTEADVDAFEALCIAWADWKDALAAIAEDGAYYQTFSESGMMRRAHPALGVRNDAWRRVIAGMSEFGLTPASRTKVSARSKDDDDPLAEFDI
jgi:P27 family predicted phage terminase small subunit